jgi:hypothetical protein
MNTFRLICFFTFLAGVVVFSEAVLPKILYATVFVFCGVAAILVISSIDVGEKDSDNL